MAKGIYIGVNSVARKVKKIYIGIGGTARKVRKAYVGVGGVARLIFSGTPEKVANPTPISVPKLGLRVAYTGNYVVMANGVNNSGYPLRPVEVYDTTLTKVTAADINSDRDGMAGATIGGYACFVGGTWRDSASNFASMFRYDSALVRSTASIPLAMARENMAVARNTSYTFFLGGMQYNDTYVRTAHAMSDSFAATSLATLPSDITAGTTSTVSTVAYAVFSTYNVAYDNARVQISFSGPGVVGNTATGSLLKNYILFTGGNKPGTGVTNEVAVYDLNLTRVSTATLSAAIQRTMNISRDDYCIVAGGIVSTYNTATRTVVSIDNYLVRDALEDLDTGRLGGSCFNIGDYGGFAGGYYTWTGGGYDVTDVVEAYRF
jgi:hypothetical protein